MLSSTFLHLNIEWSIFKMRICCCNVTNVPSLSRAVRKYPARSPTGAREPRQAPDQFDVRCHTRFESYITDTRAFRR